MEVKMARKIFVLFCTVILLLTITACRVKPTLSNPASVFCEENEGTLEIREDDSGGQVGYCVFEDGSECEEWAFFRGECQPGGN
jgi:putative hemolysin